MLTGHAKRDYQRKYMANRRAVAKGKAVRPATARPMLDPVNVRPNLLDPVRPKADNVKTSNVKTSRPAITKAIRLPHRPAGISDSQYNYIKMKAGVYNELTAGSYKHDRLRRYKW